MTYIWNPRVLGDVFVLPGTIVDDHLRLAGSAQLKILLWYARRGGGVFDPQACAAAIGLPAADCLDALQYWIQTGVIAPVEEETAAPVASPAPAPVTAPAPPPTATEPPPAAARPAAVKPRLEEVLARQASSADFAALVDTIAARLGRPLSHGDTATLLYLYDTAGLPAEVIVMVAVYAVTGGKGNLRYIEKMALDWADREILTIDAAEKELCRLEKRRQATEQIRTAFGLTAPATYSQSDTAYRWLVDWALPMELIELAGKQCVERCGKFQFGYVNKILEHWHADGITTVEQAEKPADKPKRSRRSRPTSFDVEAYDEMALKFTPVYTAKQEG